MKNAFSAHYGKTRIAESGTTSKARMGARLFRQSGGEFIFNIQLVLVITAPTCQYSALFITENNNNTTACEVNFN